MAAATRSRYTSGRSGRISLSMMSSRFTVQLSAFSELP
jgi:hypothetical protein